MSLCLTIITHQCIERRVSSLRPAQHTSQQHDVKTSDPARVNPYMTQPIDAINSVQNSLVFGVRPSHAYLPAPSSPSKSYTNYYTTLILYSSINTIQHPRGHFSLAYYNYCCIVAGDKGITNLPADQTAVVRLCTHDTAIQYYSYKYAVVTKFRRINEPNHRKG